MTAGLLFVASRRLDLGTDGFAVRNLGGLESDFSVVALFETVDDGLNVRLACAGDEELVGLGVAEEADEQVFFHELVDGGGELVFVGAGLGFDGVGHGRLGRRGYIHLDFGAFLAERVAGEGVAQLGHGAQVTGVELGHFNGLAALHHAEVRQSLLVTASVVLDGDVVLDDAADDLEEGDAAGEGVAHGLEDHHGSRLFVVDFAGDWDGIDVGCSTGRRVADGKGLALDGRGGVDLDEVEQVVSGHVGQAAGKENREDAVFADGFMQGGDQVILGYGAFLEVLLHQLVFAFGYQLNQRLMAGLGIGGQAGRELNNLAAAIAAGRIVEGFHGY